MPSKFKAININDKLEYLGVELIISVEECIYKKKISAENNLLFTKNKKVFFVKKASIELPSFLKLI